MAYEPELEAGEAVRYRAISHLTKNAKPFHIAVSDRAIFWPEIKFLPGVDPFYFRRISHHQIQEVTIPKLSPYGLWILGTLMIALGLFLLLGIKERAIEAGVITIVVGFIFLFGARNRYGLKIVTTEKTFRWAPPPVADKVSRARVTAVLDGITAACETSGLRVKDERQKIAAI